MSHALSTARRVCDYVRLLEKTVRQQAAEIKRLRAHLEAVKAQHHEQKDSRT